MAFQTETGTEKQPAKGMNEMVRVMHMKVVKIRYNIQSAEFRCIYSIMYYLNLVYKCMYVCDVCVCVYL